MGLNYFLHNKKEDIYISIEKIYKLDSRPWVIGFSGGKDSTVTVQLIFYTLMKMDKKDLSKPVYVISSDTMVENPKIISFINEQLLKMNQAAEKYKLPIYVEKVKPEINNTFWINLIGKGYPAPRQKFRWCTDRLKIDPANKFILDRVSEYGEAVVVLGVRKSESATRAQVMNTHKVEGKILRKHTKLPNSYVYAPIEDFSLDDVWTYLLQEPNPWGSNNNELLGLYQDSSGECPLVIDQSTPSCGNSRFGCWVCTVVQEDKSLKGFIESGDEWLTPLLRFRNWLLENRDIPEYREKKRMNGAVYLIGEDENKRKGLGPYTLKFRMEILRYLLETQKLIEELKREKIELITKEELKEIRDIWFEKGDWQDHVPKIYKEVYGKKMDWKIEENSFLESEDIKLLNNLCIEAGIEFELVQKLIQKEYEHYGFKHRYGILKDINKILNEEWIHYDKLKGGSHAFE